jgi:HSP20 family molecular chaperone IbpA
MLYDLFDVVFKEWTRPVKEVDVRHVYKKDYGYLLVINVLGIPEENLLVNIGDNNSLIISGSIELEEINFKNKVSYELSLGRINLEKVEYNVKDGLLYVEIYEDKPNKKEIKVIKK